MLVQVKLAKRSSSKVNSDQNPLPSSKWTALRATARCCWHLGCVLCCFWHLRNKAITTCEVQPCLTSGPRPAFPASRLARRSD